MDFLPAGQTPNKDPTIFERFVNFFNSKPDSVEKTKGELIKSLGEGAIASTVQEAPNKMNHEVTDLAQSGSGAVSPARQRIVELIKPRGKIEARSILSDQEIKDLKLKLRTDPFTLIILKKHVEARQKEIEDEGPGRKISHSFANLVGWSLTGQIDHVCKEVLNDLKEDAKYLERLEGVISSNFDYSLIDAPPIEYQQGIYKGEFQDGKPNGMGYLQMKNGDVFSGRFENGILKQGLIIKNGVAYATTDGKFENGLLEGKGISIKKGQIYTGEFKNNKAHGKGFGEDDKKDKIYEGLFENGHFKGGQVTDLRIVRMFNDLQDSRKKRGN